MGKKKNLELTRESVVAVFGEPRGEKGSEMIYPCPLCKEEGADSDDNHFKINISKGCITCFGNTEHGRELNKQYKDYINSRKRVSTIGLEENPDFMRCMQKTLKNNSEAVELLKKNG